MNKKQLFIIILALFVTMQAGAQTWEIGATPATSSVIATLNADGDTLTISGTGAMRDFTTAADNRPPWFSSRTNIRTIVIEQGVLRIGSWAFRESTAITSITIPNSVMTIGESAFADCINLTNVVIESGTRLLDFGNTAASANAFRNSPIVNLYLDRNIAYNGNNSPFRNITTLRTLIIGDYVTTIGSMRIGGYAFAGCTGLTNVVISNSVTEIQSSAFQSTALTNITIPGSVTRIGRGAFRWTALTSVTIPNTVSTIYETAFSASNLRNVVIEDCTRDLFFLGNVFYSSPIESLHLGRNLNADSPFRNIRTLRTLTIGNSVTSIGSRTFEGCTGLTNVIIPNSITWIGSRAFSGSGLTSIVIPNTVNSMGQAVFANCAHLRNVVIEDGATDLATNGAVFHNTPIETLHMGRNIDASFLNMTTLRTLTIGSKVTSIRAGAFRGCTGLTSIVIPNSVTSIGSGAFENTGLTSVVIEDGIRTLGFENTVASASTFRGSPLEALHLGRNISYHLSFSPFRDKTTLRILTIGDNVTTIGRSAFQGNTGLTSIVIPSSVNTIGYSAFEGCTGLIKVHSQSITPPDLGFPVPNLQRWAFSGVNVQTVTLYVPAVSIDRYRNAAGWRDFRFIVDENLAGRVTGVTLNKATTILNVGENEALIATIAPQNAINQNISWSSSNTDIATIDANGVITAVSAGTTTIIVTTEDGGFSATCKVTVVVPVIDVELNKATITLTVGENETLIAAINPQNATNQNVTWSSSNANVVTVDNAGRVTAIAAGTATITVTTEDGNRTATCVVTVVAASIPVTNVALNRTTATLTVGESETLVAVITPENATNQNVLWSSNNSDVATVDASGRVTAVAIGTATITVTTEDGEFSATCKVTVVAASVPVTGVSLNRTNATLAIGESETLIATITPENATNQNVTWASSNAAVATVDANGVVTAVAVGTATITVTTEDGNRTATCVVTVVAAPISVTNVSLNRTTATLVIGESETLTATIAPQNATNQNVSWSSSNPTVATVNSNGVVTAVAVGTATITVTTEDGNRTATCVVTVEEELPTFSWLTAPAIDFIVSGNTMEVRVVGASADTFNRLTVNGTEVALTEGRWIVDISTSGRREIRVSNQAGVVITRIHQR